MTVNEMLSDQGNRNEQTLKIRLDSNDLEP